MSGNQVNLAEYRVDHDKVSQASELTKKLDKVIFDELNLNEITRKVLGEIKNNGVENTVSNGLRPINNKLSNFFKKLGSELVRNSTFTAGVVGTMMTTGLAVFGNIEAMKTGSEQILNTQQTITGIAVSGGLMVAAFALPPIAKAISKLAERSEIAKYLDSGNQIANKAVAYMESKNLLSSKISEVSARAIENGVGEDVVKFAVSFAKDNILQSLIKTPLGDNEKVKAVVLEKISERIDQGYRAAIESNAAKVSGPTKEAPKKSIKHDSYSPSM